MGMGMHEPHLMRLRHLLLLLLLQRMQMLGHQVLWCLHPSFKF